MSVHRRYVHVVTTVLSPKVPVENGRIATDRFIRIGKTWRKDHSKTNRTAIIPWVSTGDERKNSDDIRKLADESREKTGRRIAQTDVPPGRRDTRSEKDVRRNPIGDAPRQAPVIEVATDVVMGGKRQTANSGIDRTGEELTSSTSVADAIAIPGTCDISCTSGNPKIYTPQEFRHLAEGVVRVVADRHREFMRFGYAELKLSVARYGARLITGWVIGRSERKTGVYMARPPNVEERMATPNFHGVPMTYIRGRVLSSYLPLEEARAAGEQDLGLHDLRFTRAHFDDPGMEIAGGP